MHNLYLLFGLVLLLTVGIRMIFEIPFLKKIMGLNLIGHALNLFLVVSGQTAPHEHALGNPAFLGSGHFEFLQDPLPQALVLTAIVINFAISAFLIVFYLTAEDNQGRF